MIKTIILALTVLLGGFFMPAYADNCRSKEWLIESFLSGSKIIFLSKRDGNGYLAAVGKAQEHDQVIIGETEDAAGVFPIKDGKSCKYLMLPLNQHQKIIKSIIEARGA